MSQSDFQLPDDGPPDAWETALLLASRTLEPVPDDLTLRVRARIRRDIVRGRMLFGALSLLTAAILAGGPWFFAARVGVRPHAAQGEVRPNAAYRPGSDRASSVAMAEILEIRDAMALPVPVDGTNISAFRVFPEVDPRGVRQSSTDPKPSWESTSQPRRS